MSAEENKALVRRLNEAISEHKLEVLDQILHLNYSVRGGSEGPWPIGVQGLENAKAAYAQMSRAVDVGAKHFALGLSRRIGIQW